MTEMVVPSFKEIVDIAMNIPLHGAESTKIERTNSIHSGPSEQDLLDARVRACGAATAVEPIP